LTRNLRYSPAIKEIAGQARNDGYLLRHISATPCCAPVVMTPFRRSNNF
jgi:hypothetical protein